MDSEDLDAIFFRRAPLNREKRKGASNAWLWIRVSQWATERELLILNACVPSVLEDAARGMGVTVPALFRRVQRKRMPAAEFYAALERAWKEQ